MDAAEHLEQPSLEANTVNRNLRHRAQLIWRPFAVNQLEMREQLGCFSVVAAKQSVVVLAEHGRCERVWARLASLTRLEPRKSLYTERCKRLKNYTGNDVLPGLAIAVSKVARVTFLEGHDHLHLVAIQESSLPESRDPQT